MKKKLFVALAFVVVGLAAGGWFLFTARVTGKLEVGATMETFHDAVIEVRLFRYDPDIADRSAAPIDTVYIRDFSHTKGQKSEISFAVGTYDLVWPGMGYYITLSVYKDGEAEPENYYLYGKPSHSDFGGVLTQNYPRHVVFQAQKVE